MEYLFLLHAAKNKENGSGILRKTVLRGLGAMGTASSITGMATADSDSPDEAGKKRERLNQVRETYSDTSRLTDYINGYGAFVSKLARDGLLKRNKVEIRGLLDACDYLDRETGTKVWGVDHPKDGKPTAHVTIRRKTERGRLTIAFNPGRSDTRPRAILKPEIPERRGKSIEATRYRVTEAGNVDKSKVEVVPKRPGEMDSTDDDSVSTSGDFSTQGTVAYLCRNRGDTSCGSYSCYSWESECFDETSCDILDCTGSACCDGCCCCQDQDRCCTVCGSSGECYEPRGCYPDSYICGGPGGCTTCEY